MGFGLLFFGYMMLINVPYKGIDFPPDVIAYTLILTALTKLGQYGKKIRIASFFSIALLALSAVKLSYQITMLFNDVPQTVINAVTVGDIVLTLPFYFFMLIGFSDLARDVELPKLQGKCRRNFGIVCFFYIFTLFFYLYNADIIPFINGVEKIQLFAMQQLLGYIMRIMNIILIASCYMRICLEGDEDMPYTPNKFEAFMTKLIKGDRNNK